MTDMLEQAARWIDGDEAVTMQGLVSGNQRVEEVAEGVAVIEAFSNVIAVDPEGGSGSSAPGDDSGLVLFDVSHALFAPGAVANLRSWSDAPVHTAVYTHGHVDHVTGADAFEDDAAARGHGPIRFVGHEAVPPRFDRYKQTAGYNGIINMRQFRLPAPMWPTEYRYPDHTYATTDTLSVGGWTAELHHTRGETDDHTWAWLPDRKALCVGDLFIWQFPNAGNPQKVQRYAWDWAVALREMIALGPELLLPAHGLPVAGADRIARVLGDTAEALEFLHDGTLEMMNAGARLDEIIHTLRLPDRLADAPYLRPTYDEPEFVIRNVWRLYGGWYTGNPAELKPAPDAALAAEVAALAGGAETLANRAEALAADGELRLACHLAEMAVLADPDNARTRAVRSAVYAQRRDAETSFMASGIYRSASLDSAEQTG